MLPLQVLWIWNHWLESRSRVDPVWIFFIVVYWFSLNFLCDACLLVEKQFTRGPSLEFVHDDWSGVEVGHRCGTWSPVTSRHMSRKTSNSVIPQVFFSWPPRLFPRFCWRCDLSRCVAQLLTFVWVVVFLFVSFFVVPFSHSLLPSEWRVGLSAPAFLLLAERLFSARICQAEGGSAPTARGTSGQSAKRTLILKLSPPSPENRLFFICLPVFPCLVCVWLNASWWKATAARIQGDGGMLQWSWLRPKAAAGSGVCHWPLERPPHWLPGLLFKRRRRPEVSWCMVLFYG